MKHLWQPVASRLAGRVGKWVVTVLWLLIIAVTLPLASRLGGVMDNNEVNWLPAGAQSLRAVQIAAREFPAADTTTLLVVYARSPGLTGADIARAEQDRSMLQRLAAAPIAPASRSADGSALLLTVPVATSAMESGEGNAIVAQARLVLGAHPADGLTIRTTGPAASRADASAASGALDSTLLIVTVSVVALLLLATYRSPLLMLLPLVCVAAAALTAQAAVALLAAHAGLTVSGTSAVLLTVLIFGAGTDYALLLISRYRDELRHTLDCHAATATALSRTLPATSASAATVILALLTLMLATMNSTSGLGPVAAVGVAAALLAMTTLLPALLVLFGRGVFWPRIPRPGTSGDAALHSTWSRVADLVGRHPRRIWITTAVALAGIGLGLTTVSIGGYHGADAFTRPPEFVAGQQLLTAHFPSGTSSPVLLYTSVATAAEITNAAEDTAGVAAVGPAQLSATGAWARIPAILADDPDSEAAKHTVQRLRDSIAAVDTHAVAGGRSAAARDQQQAMNHDLKLLIPLILLAVVTVLGLLLRAVIAPVMLLACVTLSAAASLSAASLIFRALGYPRIDPTVLLFGFLFLIALGVDYTIFLMSRARQDAANLGHRRGALNALTVTAGVITSAGLVLAATFAVLAITPVVINLQLGVLVATGILLDTLIVRTLLVPALTLHIGPKTWWPGMTPVP